MKNETAQPKLTWETPDMTVLPINEVTLGAGEAGFDFASEIST
ncbi:hypothetical protein [Chitinophaga rhizophila]|nr:hypothetical protein [Chitinophaga rhizophila]